MIRRIATLATALVLMALSGHARAERQFRLPPGTPPNVAELYKHTPVIELMTMGVGSLIWERHGHIALCVRYDDPADDRCYNYGIADFHHPIGMAWGFLRGTNSFWVGKSSVDEMMSVYVYADRTIFFQPLPLTDEQKQKVIAKLEHDILEPNKYYAYDHFWDNCTTRVRDVIDNATGGELSKIAEPTDGRTYRDLAREGFFGMRVPLLITDIQMGRVTDRVPSYYERMFLPQYLREAVTQHWNIPPMIFYQRHGDPPLTDGPSGRVWFALVIVLLTAPAWLTRLLGRGQGAGMAIAVLPYALLGTVLLGLAIISPLSYVRWNETCLVLLPFDVLLLVLPPERRRRYARARLVMLAAVALLALIGVLTQPLFASLLWPAIPLAVTGLWPERATRVGQIDAAEPVKPQRSKAHRRKR